LQPQLSSSVSGWGCGLRCSDLSMYSAGNETNQTYFFTDAKSIARTRCAKTCSVDWPFKYAAEASTKS